jgi:hypothetical protein
MRGGMIFNPGGTRAVARVVILLLAAHLGSESRVRAQTLEDQRKRANDAFQYGDFGAAIQVLSHMDIEGLPTERERIEAYRVLGLSYFYAKKPTPGEATQKAREAFFGLLKQDPDFQLDALFVPPDAIAFFDRIRQEEEPALAPVRKIHNELKQKEAEQERIRREAQPGKPRIVNVAVSSQVVALLPFGFGQFQNGNIPLGIGMAVGQGAGAITSILSYIMVEALRDPTSGEYAGNNYLLAKNFNIAQLVGAGLFFGLWIAGISEAFAHFVPSHPLPDGPPSAAPAGPLKPPGSEAAPRTP